METLLSVKEAAGKLGLSERHLRLLLKMGEVKGKKLGGTWVVLSLDYIRKKKRKGG
jgi:excisionase family DNA binding protein